MFKGQLTDFNTCLESGIYRINRPSNGPSASLWGVALVINAETYYAQVIFNVTGSGRTMYYRIGTADVGFGTAWNKVTAVEI